MIQIENIAYDIVCYYRQPTRESYEPFIQDLENELKNSDKTPKIIIGDVNLDAKGDNIESRRYM